MQLFRNFGFVRLFQSSVTLMKKVFIVCYNYSSKFVAALETAKLTFSLSFNTCIHICVY